MSWCNLILRACNVFLSYDEAKLANNRPRYNTFLQDQNIGARESHRLDLCNAVYKNAITSGPIIVRSPFLIYNEAQPLKTNE